MMVDTGYGIYHQDISRILSSNVFTDPTRLQHIIITHGDTDHAGGAGFYDTSVTMHPLTFEVIRHANRAYGSIAETSVLEAVYTTLINAFSACTMPRSVELISPTEIDRRGIFPILGHISIGNIEFEVLWSMGGHLAGQIYLLSCSHGLLFSADTLINFDSLSKERQEYNTLAVNLVTSVNVDSAIARQEWNDPLEIVQIADAALVLQGKQCLICGGHGAISTLRGDTSSHTARSTITRILVVRYPLLPIHPRYNGRYLSCMKIPSEHWGPKDTLNSLYQKGTHFAALNRHEESITCYDRIIALDRGFLSARVAKAVSLDRLGRFAEAVATCDRALEIGLRSADLLFAKANALYHLGVHSDAIIWFTQAIIEDPTLSEAWYTMGNTHFTLRNFDEAIACYDRALEINPRAAKAYYNRGVSLEENDQHNEAITCYDRYLAINPNDAAIGVNRGVCLAQLERFEEALASFDRVLQANPKNIYALNNKGMVLRKMKRLKEAYLLFAEVQRIVQKSRGPLEDGFQKMDEFQPQYQ